MNALNSISQVFQTSEEIPLDKSSKIVIMSDCHRGTGNKRDDFIKNQKLCFTALNYYYDQSYTYIELGDGDELWENKRFSDIVKTNLDIFLILSKFYKENRLYFVYGNHDIVKRDDNYVRDNLYYYYDGIGKRYIPLFRDIKIHEGLILKDKVNDNKILLIHGHQVDILNNQLWKISRFLVRYLWRLFEALGINDPTSAAKNHNKKDLIEKKLIEWVKNEKHMLIAGHTHRMVFPAIGEQPYFNSGSCVYENAITAIEISEGNITLVKWTTKTHEDSTTYFTKEVIASASLSSFI